MPIKEKRRWAEDSVMANGNENKFTSRPPVTADTPLDTARDALEPPMNADQILNEIRETNLSYLMLAQSLIRADRDQALFRLGLSETAATMIAALSPAQVLKIASSNTLLCRMRVDDDLVWTLLTNHGKGAGSDNVTRLHANILMAGKYQEAA